MVVKSVQRGSLAEVRPTGWPLRWGSIPAGRVSMSFEVDQFSRLWNVTWCLSSSCSYGETEPGTSCLSCKVAGK